MDLPVMKYLAESMRNTADALLETMRDGKTFVCDECFGGNFEACEANEPNAIRMVAGGKESWWCCGYCRLKLKNEKLESMITTSTQVLQNIVERDSNGTIRGTMTDVMRRMEQDVNDVQHVIKLLTFHNGD